MLKNNKRRALAILLLVILTVGMIGSVFIGKKVLTKVYEILDSFRALEDVLEKVNFLMGEMQNSFLVMSESELGGGRVRLAKAHLEYDFDYSWAQNGPNLIAHAFGGIDGNTYTNSLEAFQKNYQQGHRIFEVDFSLTVPENTLVATHAGMEIEDSYAEFMDRKILDNYTALDYRDVIDLMVEYPDIYIVTDTKFVDKPSVQLAFAQLVRYANATDATVLDRIVPQIYHENMLQWVMEVYPFASIIYTLYQTVWTPENVSDFCEETNVGFVTIEKGIVTQEIIDQWKAQGIIVACFTENDQEVAANLFGWGADFIYTDFLLPSDFE